ncbi:MAG: altronate dehydratase [Planctomycetales bacterium]|nr:altronate dehydratase [Planctomycetales bacterium]
MSQPNPTIRLNPHDNVVVARTNLAAGTEFSDERGEIRLKSDIVMGHKIASNAIATGDEVVKYGQPIGIASETIEAGDWVHSHNLKNNHRDIEYEFSTNVKPPTPIDSHTFEGYKRPNGKAGTRNYIAVISNVNCSASVSKYVARHFTTERLADYPNVDGVVALTHHGGCAMQFGGQQHQLLNRVMGGMARHPNIGGYLLIGLGCEQATLDYLIDDQQLVQIEGFNQNAKQPLTLTMQASGGTQKTITAAVDHIEAMLPEVNAIQRETIPASEIILATECGGSDGNSGITANPAVGVAGDLLVACGGTSILAETTEVIGAEHLLTRRAISESVGRKLLDRIEWWRWYANIFGEVVDNNRSAGNAAGGLTTIVEKSLGAVAKAGQSPLYDVYQYAEQITSRGLVLMDTPGFDPCSITGMVAGGANMVVFTTGRGSCYGCKPAPSIKIATNTPMYERLSDDMDINAGRVLDDATLDEVGNEIFQEILAVASGKPTKSESLGIGDEEFVPWMIGPIL